MTSSREKRKLADALADAGVGSRRVAIELLYLLPDSFVAAYEQLFWETFSLGDEGKGKANEKQADLGRAKGSGASSGSSSRKGSVFPVRSEEKLAQKTWVDRQLRKLARGMATGEGAAEESERFRCGQRRKNDRKNTKAGCGKWNEKNWTYCPFCGHQNKVKIVNNVEADSLGLKKVVDEDPSDSDLRAAANVVQRLHGRGSR